MHRSICGQSLFNSRPADRTSGENPKIKALLTKWDKRLERSGRKVLKREAKAAEQRSDRSARWDLYGKQGSAQWEHDKAQQHAKISEQWQEGCAQWERRMDRQQAQSSAQWEHTISQQHIEDSVRWKERCGQWDKRMDQQKGESIAHWEGRIALQQADIRKWEKEMKRQRKRKRKHFRREKEGLKKRRTLGTGKNRIAALPVKLNRCKYQSSERLEEAALRREANDFRSTVRFDTDSLDVVDTPLRDAQQPEFGSNPLRSFEVIPRLVLNVCEEPVAAKTNTSKRLNDDTLRRQASDTGRAVALEAKKQRNMNILGKMSRGAKILGKSYHPSSFQFAARIVLDALEEATRARTKESRLIRLP